jgi:hypothetical protein
MTDVQEHILHEARKNVLGNNGRPTTLQPAIDEAFPLHCPDWDFGTTEGRERLQIYCQTLMAGLRAAAFFSIPLSEISQPLFAFEWQEDGGWTGQLTWTRLPQGFKNFPTLFNKALSQDLEPFCWSHL